MGNLNEKLVGAVEQNRLADVKDLLKLGASPDAQDKVDGWTVLTKACLHGFESIVKVLLENQASVNLPNRIGGTALTYAAMRGHHAIVKILLRTSADIQYKTITGRTAFDWAMNKCYMPIAGDLLMASPNVHGYNVKDLSKLLEWACQANQVAVVKKIVEGRQDINWDATVPGDILQLVLSSSSDDGADVVTGENIGYNTTDEGDETKLVASGEQTRDPFEDLWQTASTSTTTSQIPQPVESVVAVDIGTEGGQLQSSDMSVVIPEGAVSSSTTFSAKIYLNPHTMPPTKSDQQVVLSPAVRLSSSLPRSLQFNKPVQLTLSPEVPMQTSRHNSGWLLELMRSESSPDELPNEWKVVLEYNTNKGKVVSHSPFVHYDSKTCSLYVDHFCWFSWIGRPLQALGSMLGINVSALREIDYAVFGKQVHRHKWCIATHIVHGARSIYDSLAKKLEADGYIKLSPPNRDCIGYYGEVTLIIECTKPWQMYQGKSRADIETKRIWRCEQDSTCYYECTVEDRKKSADDLECTVTAVYQSRKSKDTHKPVELNICHSLDKPQQKQSVSDGVDPDSHCALLATKVRNASVMLGGCVGIQSEFPTTVLDEVSELVACHSKAHLLADNLPSYKPQLGEQIVQSVGYVRRMLEHWITSDSSEATLEFLFQAVHRAGLYHAVWHAIEHRIEAQSLPPGNNRICNSV
jgi:hypothetical protein